MATATMSRAEKKAAKELDAQIEKAWYRLASGVQVDIMEIGKIFDECREPAMAGSAVLEDAIHACIAKYRKN